MKWAASISAIAAAQPEFVLAADALRPGLLPSLKDVWDQQVWMAKLGPLTGPVSRALSALGRWNVRSWSAPLYELRAELGLPRGADPIFEGQHSPELVLALFSPLLGAPQPDWPPNSYATGFAFYDRLDRNRGLPAGLPCNLAVCHETQCPHRRQSRHSAGEPRGSCGR